MLYSLGADTAAARRPTLGLSGGAHGQSSKHTDVTQYHKRISCRTVRVGREPDPRHLANCSFPADGTFPLCLVHFMAFSFLNSNIRHRKVCQMSVFTVETCHQMNTWVTLPTQELLRCQPPRSCHLPFPNLPTPAPTPPPHPAQCL